MKMIVLAAGGTNTTDAHIEPLPKCLHRFDETSTILDRTIEVSRRVGVTQLAVVGGYQIGEIMARYPQLRYYYNPQWRDSGSLRSLLAAEGEVTDDVLVSYSDVVFDPRKVAELSASHGELVVATDSRWATRYEGRTPSLQAEAEKLFLRDRSGALLVSRRSPNGHAWRLAGEFAGLFLVRAAQLPSLFTVARELVAHDQRVGIGELVNALSALLAPKQRCVIDFEGQWAELDSEQDLTRFRFGTKAETLERLRGRLSSARVLPQYTIEMERWRGDRRGEVLTIQTMFQPDPLVVRSSARNEDTASASLAGNYESVLNVDSRDQDAVERAIEEVCTSYTRKGEGVQADDQVLVQPMLSDVRLSGVAFTADLETSAPYYLINYDTTGSTDAITAGERGRQETVVVYKFGQALPRDEGLRALVTSLREIEAHTHLSSLDVEFAITSSNEVVIFQVRPIAAHKDQLQVSAAHVGHELAHIAHYISCDRRDATTLCGTRCAWGVMPDWNPAEIIGIDPKPLAFSLYRTVITDRVWGESREECGYRATAPRPGIVDFGGKPYVDIRMSFTSFTPRTLPKPLSDRLVAAAVDHLCDHRGLHDKVEFAVMPTAFDLDFSSRIAHLADRASFTSDELQRIEGCYRDLTCSIIGGTHDVVAYELSRLTRLDEKRGAIVEASRREEISLSAAVALLLEECRTYGTLPFSNLARYAFIGVVQLKALVARKLLSQTRVDLFLASIQTVAKGFVHDLASLSSEELRLRYGHLRPGTYEITSPAYHEEFERYVDLSSRPTSEPLPTFTLTTEERNRIDRELSRAGIVHPNGSVRAGEAINAEELFRFIRDAVQGREEGKFAFTRNLSAAIDLITLISQREGLSREEASYLTMEEISPLSGSSRPAGLASQWRSLIRRRQRRHRVTRALKLPPVIASLNDLECFTIGDEQPNYITQRVVEATPSRLSRDGNGEIDGKIVLIENADPGFDWVFSHPIAALVTKYGGANSHMAIRCAEFELPAAIGCGQAIFERLSQAKYARLDCGARRVEVIR